MVITRTKTIHIPKSDPKFPIHISIVEDILDIFYISHEGTLRKISDTEYYLFSEKQWNTFKQKEMEKQSSDNEYFSMKREGRLFMRQLYDKAGTVAIKNTHIYISPFTRQKILQDVSKITLHVVW